MPVNTIIEFILVVAPGFLVYYVYRSRFPAKRVSQFTEITLSIIWGVAIYAVVTWIDAALLSNTLFSKTHLFVFVLFSVGFVIGQLGVLSRHLLFKLPKNFPLREKIIPMHRQYETIWPLVISEAPRDEWAVVFLKDGAIYMGFIDTFRFDPNTENQDFLLINARRINDDLEEIYLVTGIGVYLNTRDVIRIEFIKGRPKSTPEAS